MTENRDESAPLCVEDEAFAERLAASFSPGPLSPARRAAFDDALAGRLERRRSRRLVPALAAAAGVTAAALAWRVAPGVFDPTPTGRGGADDVVAEAAAAARWELDLLDLDSLTDADGADDAERLPDDYVAIAGLFLEM
jgi:hypothetical protein